MSTISIEKKNLIVMLEKILSEMHIGEKEQLEIVTSPNVIVIRKSKKRNISEIKGLGKEIWKDIDVEKYIEKERNSWG